jgi:cholesterol transport system auxiliary component
MKRKFCPGRKAVAIFVAALLVTGCAEGLLSGLGGPAPDLYTLTPKTSFRQDLKVVSWQLVVEEPVAAGGLNVDRIALRNSPTDMKYFSGARWTERAPRMVQTLLVESFENSGAIVSVGRQAIGLRSDYNLKSELREFQAEYFEDDIPSVRVRLNVKLVKQPRRNIIASRNVEAVTKAEGKSMQDVINAFDVALGKVLRRTVEWGLTQPR